MPALSEVIGFIVKPRSNKKRKCRICGKVLSKYNRTGICFSHKEWSES